MGKMFYFYNVSRSDMEALVAFCLFWLLCLATNHSSTQEREAMGVKFLARGNNSRRDPQPGIKPETSRLPGQCLSRLGV